MILWKNSTLRFKAVFSKKNAVPGKTVMQTHEVQHKVAEDRCFGIDCKTLKRISIRHKFAMIVTAILTDMHN